MSPSNSSIGNALFTKTQQKVLGLLYARPDKTYYMNEIVRLSDIGKGTINRELKKLCTAGLLTMTKQGNQSHYQANSASPIYKELISIVQKTFGIADVLSHALGSLMPKLELAFIYGSLAKGTEHSKSDIDLMLVGADLNYANTIELLIDAETQLGRPINPTLYSPKEFRHRLLEQNNFVITVLQQKIVWLAGETIYQDQYKDLLKPK
jgi:predicted nucleotidyltransferase